jgi:hypothetical protein
MPPERQSALRAQCHLELLAKQEILHQVVSTPDSDGVVRMISERSSSTVEG